MSAELLPPLAAVALCVLFAWGFARASGDRSGVDPWQLAVGCVIVATLVSWYTGGSGG